MAIDPRDHERLVITVALRHGADSATVRDSEQYSAGMLALVVACQRFDATRGIQPSTYLWRCVEGQIRSALTKRRAGQPAYFAALPEDLPEPPGRDVLADANEKRCLALLARLDARTRQLVRETVMEGRTLAEVAEESGVCKQRIHQLVKAGVERLRLLAGVPARRKRPRQRQTKCVGV